MELHPMNDEGAKIVRAIRQIRRLHEDVSLLLRKADDAMREHGWKIAKSDSRALYEASSSIDRPQQWMPWEVYRYYRHDDRPTVLASITVLLDDTQRDFPEPLVLGSVFEFEDATSAAAHRYWAGAMYRVASKGEPAGEIVEVHHQLVEKGWDFESQRGRYFTYPLVAVTSEEILREKIVGKLLSLLGVLA